MLQRYRGWILVVGLLVIAVAGTVIGLRLTSGPKLDSAGLASYMPERDAATLYIDVAALRSSGILDKLVGSTVGEEAEYKTFVQQTGFDYKRDLDRLMANSAGRNALLPARWTLRVGQTEELCEGAGRIVRWRLLFRQRQDARAHHFLLSGFEEPDGAGIVPE